MDLCGGVCAASYLVLLVPTGSASRVYSSSPEGKKWVVSPHSTPPPTRPAAWGATTRASVAVRASSGAQLLLWQVALHAVRGAVALSPKSLDQCFGLFDIVEAHELPPQFEASP